MQKPVAMRLELVPLPVADVDRARDFYVEKLGFHLDHDGNTWTLQEIPDKGESP